MSKRWTKAEVADLEKSASGHSVDELARRFRTDTNSVNKKLTELGLEAAAASSARTDDPALDDFTRGVELLHEKKWQEASELFESVITKADGLQLADRARQHLTICKQQSAGDSDGGDPYLRAVYEKNRGNLDEALALCEQHGGADTEERFAYLMASIRALGGEEDQALEHLATAIELEPKNRVHAFHDSDFTALRGREEFLQLVQAP